LLSEEFLEQFKDYINWRRISVYQKLSESFIRKYKHKFDWKNIDKFQKLSSSFREEFKYKLDFKTYKNNKKSWLYASNETKIEYIRTKTKFEIIDNSYIISYGSTNIARFYSIFYQASHIIEFEKTYISHCDYTIETEDSFGLRSFSFNKAKELSDTFYDGKIFKIKVFIEDIGAIVEKNNKVRSCKLTVLGEV
jgi:hypothetical protein